LINSTSITPLLEQCLHAASDIADDVIRFTAELTAIPAPTFHEEERASFYARHLQELELGSVAIDDVSNVTARVSGRDSTGCVVLAGHIDTVFPLGTPLVIERKGLRLSGPGIGDNCLGAAAVAYVPKMLERLGIVPATDVVITGNVGEEGLGDLRGIRAVCDRTQGIRGVIAVEGHNLGRVTHIAVGSRRLRVRVTGPGGHSWGDFGRPNAIHYAAEIITDLAQIPTPPSPKTTLTVGTISGGISVNTIPPEVTFLIDIRSIDPNQLGKTLDRVERVLRSSRPGVQVTWEVIGDRPAGAAPFEDPIVKHALEIIRELGINPIPDASSTDANIPISRGIPAVCIGLTTGGNAHRVDEYIDLAPVAHGLAQLTALTILSANHFAQ
jgi:acetylornithine deacetylase/succinyl-diaminopimelate desuccinylase-like protein